MNFFLWRLFYGDFSSLRGLYGDSSLRGFFLFAGTLLYGDFSSLRGIFSMETFDLYGDCWSCFIVSKKNLLYGRKSKAGIYRFLYGRKAQQIGVGGGRFQPSVQYPCVSTGNACCGGANIPKHPQRLSIPDRQSQRQIHMILPTNACISARSAAFSYPGQARS